MGKRLVMGPILIAMLLAGLWVDERLTGADLPRGSVVLAIMAIVAVLASREVATLFRAKGMPASWILAAVAALAGLGVWAASAGEAAGATVAVGVLVLGTLWFAVHRRVDGVLAGIGGLLVSFVYLGVLFGFLYAIRREHSAWMLLWVLLTTKACDIGAYFTGKAVGRHKLIPWLSPGKTWEGLAGGVVLAAAVSYAGLLVLSSVQPLAVPSPVWAVLPGVVFALVGQAGDLLESLLKRDAGLKDSGASVPGMGGVLDVIDSPLVVGPAAFWLLRWYTEAGLLGPPGAGGIVP